MKRFHLECFDPRTLKDDDVETVVEAKETFSCSARKGKHHQKPIEKKEMYVLVLTDEELDEMFDLFCKQKCSQQVSDRDTWLRCLERQCRTALIFEHLIFARSRKFHNYAGIKMRHLLEEINKAEPLISL